MIEPVHPCQRGEVHGLERSARPLPADHLCTGAHLKVLEREVVELKRANEILRKDSAYFAQAELDRQTK